MFIEVWLLPELSEAKAKTLYDEIVACVRSIPTLQNLPGKAMPVAFPKDIMAWGLGTEIVVKVMDIPLPTEGKEKLLVALCNLMAKIFPEAKAIYCYEIPTQKVASLLQQ